MVNGRIFFNFIFSRHPAWSLSAKVASLLTREQIISWDTNKNSAESQKRLNDYTLFCEKLLVHRDFRKDGGSFCQSIDYNFLSYKNLTNPKSPTINMKIPAETQITNKNEILYQKPPLADSSFFTVTQVKREFEAKFTAPPLQKRLQSLQAGRILLLKMTISPKNIAPTQTSLERSISKVGLPVLNFLKHRHPR